MHSQSAKEADTFFWYNGATTNHLLENSNLYLPLQTNPVPFLKFIADFNFGCLPWLLQDNACGKLGKTKMDAARLNMGLGLPKQITQSRNKRTLAHQNSDPQNRSKSKRQ